MFGLYNDATVRFVQFAFQFRLLELQKLKISKNIKLKLEAEEGGLTLHNLHDLFNAALLHGFAVFAGGLGPH